MSGMPLFTRIKTRWFYALAPYKAADGVFSLLFPLFLLNVLDMQVGTVGVLTALVSLTAVSGSMFWGYLSDRRHLRRPLLVLGCTGSALCLAGMGLAWSMPQMILLCLAYGALSIAPAPVSSVLIMETTSPTHWEKTFGTFNKIGGWGWVSGLAIGIFWLPFLGQWFADGQNLRVAFFGLAVAALCSSWWVWRTVPEPVQRVRRQQYVHVAKRLPALTLAERALYLPRRLLFVVQPEHLAHLQQMLHGPFLRYLLATIVMFVSFTTALTPFPLFLQTDLGFDTPLIFTLVLARALVSAPLYETAGCWAQRLGPKKTHILALSVRGVAFLVFYKLQGLSQPELLMTVLIGMNVLLGITWPLLAVSGPALVGRLVAPDRKGEAIGLFNATQGLSHIVGAAIGGYLAQWIGYYGVFAVAAILLIGAIGLLVSLQPPRPAAPRRAPRLMKAVAS
jgi:MFS family permease